MLSDYIFLKETILVIFFWQNYKLNGQQSKSYHCLINLNFYLEYILNKTNKINGSDQTVDLWWTQSHGQFQEKLDFFFLNVYVDENMTLKIDWDEKI